MTPIVTVPEPVLRQIAKPVKVFDKKIQAIVADMVSTLLAAKDPEGVGLAAPQIGISLRIFLMRPTKRTQPRLFINPEIIELSKETQSPDENDGVYEGCLSIPNHYAPLSRALTITLTYYVPKQENGVWNLELKQEKFTGFPAHIIQHEVDHLNGTLFTDHVLAQGSKLFKVAGKEWEEVSL